MPRDRRPDAVTVGGGAGGGRLRALVVDDEAPALAELSCLLRRDDRIGEVRTASQRHRGAAGARRGAASTSSSATSRCPASTAWTWPGCIARFAHRPQVVFVTAYDEHAVDAFALRATDYVMKPVRAERLAEAVRRVVAQPAATPG